MSGRVTLTILIGLSGIVSQGQELVLTDPGRTNFISWRVKDQAEENVSSGPEIILSNELLEWGSGTNDFVYFKEKDSLTYSRNKDYKELYDFVHQQFTESEIAEILSQATTNNKKKFLSKEFVNSLNKSKRQRGRDKRSFYFSNPILIRNLLVVREKWVDHPDVWIEITTKIYMKMSEFDFIELKTLDKVSSGL